MTIDELLARARQRLDRVTTEDALDAVRDGAVLVDIRSELQRAADGLMPGAIFHPRNVLEWRCDATSGYDDPRLSGDPDRRIVLVCDEGYQSSLAAAMLQDLGLARATDLVGGFQAWAAAGLPVIRDVARVYGDEFERAQAQASAADVADRVADVPVAHDDALRSGARRRAVTGHVGRRGVADGSGGRGGRPGERDRGEDGGGGRGRNAAAERDVRHDASPFVG